jgi:transposase-like protein
MSTLQINLCDQKRSTSWLAKTTTVRFVVVRQVADYSPKGYSEDVKRHCLTLYVNGMGFRAIERCKECES